VKKRIDIHTGGDADDIDLKLVRAKQLAMNTNGGIDDVSLESCRFTTLNIKLGAARDNLRIKRTRSSLVTNLNGEAQGANYANINNSLRNVFRRHLG
jgi:hypothetical protein